MEINMNQPQPNNQINIKLDEKIGEGIYANFFVISNSPSEFIMDFGRIVPGLPDARIYSRVMTTPQHAKQMLQLLEKNIENFEKQFGEIKIIGQPDQKAIGFKTNSSGEQH